MPEIKLQQAIENDKYCEYVYQSYDIQNKILTETTIVDNLTPNINYDYNLGVICGSSASGKTTLLKALGDVIEPKFDSAKALISNFTTLEPSQAAELLASVGLGSVPSWLRPFKNLSNGEQARAGIAQILSEDRDLYLIDEFSSTVDANVRKSMSNALQKYIRRTNRKVVLATPHEDVLEWLQPDWVYSTNTCQLESADCLWRRPDIQLEIFRCKYEAWEIFQQHHYLTPELHKSSACFMVTWEGQVVGFMATLDFPGLPQPSKRVTRYVVLPDFQGLGIGKKVLDYMAGLYKQAGYTLYIRTVNPALGVSLMNSSSWTTKKEQRTRPRVNNDKFTGDRKFLNKYLINRPSYSAKYTGEPIADATEIVTKKNKELDENKQSTKKHTNN